MPTDAQRRAPNAAASGTRLLACACLVLLLSCSSYRPARFYDLEPAQAANDQLPIPLPARTVTPDWARYSEAYVKRWLIDGLDPRRTPEAEDINAMDVVVESSWFAPQRPPSLEGYTISLPAAPFTPVDDEDADKLGLRFVDDAAGRRWEVIPEAPERTILSTAAGAICSRLMYALGYHAAESHVVYDETGARSLMIAWASVRGAAASSAGVGIGPTSPTGTRDDDPNDVIPHERRRTLRALALVADWLGMDEIEPRALRDVYAGEPGKGYVQHQVSDLHDALGAGALLDGLRREQDRPDQNPLVALGSLGFSRKELGDPADSPYPSVGIFPLHVDPAAHRLAVPFGPAREALIGDIYWIGKRIAAIPDRTIRYAVAAGLVEPPEAASYLRRSLAQRRDDVARFAMSFVTPVELEGQAKLAIDAASAKFVVLTLVDEAIRLGHASAAGSSYVVESMDREGERVGASLELEPSGDKLVITIPYEQIQERDYLVVRVRSKRSGALAPRWTELHLRRKDHEVRVRGIRH